MAAVLDPEWETFEDERTGARVTRLTNAPCINHPLYYLANSFSLDGQTLVFASDRAGKMDLYKVHLGDGAIERLTDLEGVQPFSGNVVDDGVYFAAGSEVHCLRLQDGTDRVIASRPGCGLGEVTVSADRQWACCLVTREGAAGLLVSKTDGSASTVILDGVRALYHPQFHPQDADLLIYSADPPDPRLWTVRRDGREDRCFYANRLDEWFVHETFLGKSDRVIVVCWHQGLYEVGLQTGDIREIVGFSSWHIASNSDGSQIVCDTHLPDQGLCLVDPQSGEYAPLCYPNATNQGFQWGEPSPLQADGEAPGWATMTENVSAESAYGPQWSHPHPAFSPDDRMVSFTSDVTGYSQVYVVEVPEK
ncbi:MAG: hypothetical protein O7G87_05700 [bacterium]|nr:hypothetical protein [bacterium]